MLARMMAFLVWGLLACAAVYWLIQLMARPLAAPPHALAVSEQRSGSVDLSRLLGATPVAVAEAPPVAEGRFSLLGVVAPKDLSASQAGEGVALIAVDGVPRTVRIGALLDGELYLLAVDARSAQLGQRGQAGQGPVVQLTLNLAAPAAPATGSLPTAQVSPTVLGGQPHVMPAMPVPPSADGAVNQLPIRPGPPQNLSQNPPVDANGVPTR